MNDNPLMGLGAALPEKPDATTTELITIQPALRRVLAFTGHTIDDVINDPIARNRVTGYYKLYRWIDRESEVSELERQWNVL